MSDIEQLTQEERHEIFESSTTYELKLLRIHDAQVRRIAELEEHQVTPAMQTEFEMGKEQRDKLRRRIRELEAQVLASETVSKVEYVAMVEQRNTMREELKAARHLLVDALPWLKTYDEDADELNWLIGAIEALPPFRA